MMDALTLLLILLVCHWAADFSPLSRPWMLEAKEKGSPLLPVLAHAGVHSSLMFVAILLFTFSFNIAFVLALVQLITHFLIDIWKGKISYHFPLFQDKSKNYFWMLFGVDQLLHHVVLVFMLMTFLLLNR